METKAATVLERRIWFFGGGTAEGGADDVAILGGKGAHLHEMSRLGLPVPPGFTIPTGLCHLHLTGGLPEWFRDEITVAGPALP
jgi:pyruvate,orthophosphate dikinase